MPPSPLRDAYSPSPTVEILPPALAAFQRAFPHVNVLLHDASQRELAEGLQNGTLELAITPGTANLQIEGIEFEVLRSYPLSVALAPTHPLARFKVIPLEKVGAEPLVGFDRKDYPDYFPFI